jgi:hypothetical protein
MKIVAFALALSALVLLPPAAPLHAHHGGAVEYFMDKTAGPITGTVTTFAFRFPHPYIEFDVKDASGATQKWTAVMQLTPTRLRALGWTRDSVKPGDTLTVTYSPHRSAPTVGFARRVEVNGKLLGEGV